MEAANDPQGDGVDDTRSVLIVGAGPAGLMLAYVSMFSPSPVPIYSSNLAQKISSFLALCLPLFIFSLSAVPNA